MEASEGLDSIESSVGAPPPLPTSEPAPAQDPVLVDAKVGDINGRAIYASRFLESRADKLRANADEQLRQAAQAGGRDALARADAQWTREARLEIMKGLNEQLEDELLRAEAISRFTPEQKQGFRAFLDKSRSKLYAESGGSATGAERRLLETQGKTLDEWYRQEEQKQLIGFELSQTIAKRLQISWRDIVNEYDKQVRLARARGDAAHFRLILVPKDNAADVDAVRSQLTAGEPFERVASSPLNTNHPEIGGLRTTKFKPPFETASLIGLAPMNDALHSLSPGEWKGPIEAGSDMGWIMLEKLETSNVPPLSGLVQLDLENSLQQSRGRLERFRYIDRLKERASFSDLEQMTRRLMVFARERCFIPAVENAPR
jgi:hypothetical protein